MEGLGVAASVIAVVELSAKIASICFQYSLAVKHAKADIERLREEVSGVIELLRAVETLLQRPDSTQLSTSQKLQDALMDCFTQLVQVNMTLDLGKRQKIMSSVGLRALKWPFESKDVEKVIKNLERYKQAISLALQVDQTALVLGITQKIDLAKLPCIMGAAFDSHLDEHEARCLPNTRIELRREIAKWAEDAQGKCIFWLNGMAGTGKSTISRTVAQSFADKGQLGGSFFFKRGEGDRGNASRFFTTIAAQLATKIPSLGPFIGKAIDVDPAISEKALKEQFEKLILQPLSDVQSVFPQASKVVIVVDALDECERQEDIKLILLLLSQFRDNKTVCLRIFVTSRPELPIRLGFKNMTGDTYQDLVLQEISQATIEHDISAFLEHELKKIRDDHSLAVDWPGKQNIQTLVTMAVPLFIFAATVCRFVGDPIWDPKKRLATILESQTLSQVSKFDSTYLPILNQMLIGQDEIEKEMLALEFRELVGAIVVLKSPLSTISLASLLDIPKDEVSCRLKLLHSVLSIPTNQAAPIRLFHLSFRDFLLDPLKREKSLFWVDERMTHKSITSKCFRVMSKCLKKNICGLQKPGTFRSEIDSRTINVYLPTEVKYACRYWVYHLEQSKSRMYDSDQVHVFLQEHLLHWLEALSLLGNTSQSITMLTTLLSNIEADKSPGLHEFIQDAKRFTLYNRSVIEQAPLQLYCSALVFASEKSIVRRQFEKCIPPWIQMKTKVQANSNAALQTLEGHSGPVSSIAFSPDGKVVASGSRDSTVRLWDSGTGAPMQALKGRPGQVLTVAFSPDGKLVASGSYDSTIRLWDSGTGAPLQALEGHSGPVLSIAFSLDGKVVASGSRDSTARLWDSSTGALLQALKGHSGPVSSVAFSPDGKVVASGSHDSTVQLWDNGTGAPLQALEGHSGPVLSVAFSPDGKVVALGSRDSTVRLWDSGIGTLLQALKGHSGPVLSVAFSPDSKLVASGSSDNTVQLWDSGTRAPRQALKGHSGPVLSVAFSPDGKLVASGSYDSTVRLWDSGTGAPLQALEGHSGWDSSVASGSYDSTVRLWDSGIEASLQALKGHSGWDSSVASGSGDSTARLWDSGIRAPLQALKGRSGWVLSVAFSPDGKLVASGSRDSTVRLWDSGTGAPLQALEGHSGPVLSVAFSPDGKVVASGSRDSTVRLWDSGTGAPLQALKGHSGPVSSVAFSPDSKVVASGSGDSTARLWDKGHSGWVSSVASVSQGSTVRLWDIGTGALLQTLKGHLDPVSSVAFSPDGKLIASGSGDSTVRLWDSGTGAPLQTLKGHSDPVTAVAFSPDGKVVASGSSDNTVRLWDSGTGAPRQTLEVSVLIDALSFSALGQFLKTDRGLLRLQPCSMSSGSLEQSFAPFVIKDWVTEEGQNILWLPPDYRATYVAVWNELMVLGHSSGGVSFLQFTQGFRTV